MLLLGLLLVAELFCYAAVEVFNSIADQRFVGAKILVYLSGECASAKLRNFSMVRSTES